jgi:hypothetical protein
MSEFGDVVSAKLAEYGIVPERGEDLPQPSQEQQEMPAVEIVPVMSTMAREIGGILSNNGVFVRQRSPMTISQEGRLVEMTARRFRTYCEEHLVTFKWHSPKPEVFERKAQTITVEAAATILESDQFLERQRELLRVATVRQPVKRKDGRIELLPYGYDSASQTLTQNSGVEFVHDLPLDAARTQLKNLLREFPFGDRKEDGSSRNEAIVVAGMLAMFAAPLLRPQARRLNFMFSSNSVGSGKTLLAQMAIITTLGACDVQPLPENQEDWRKILDTESLAGSPYIIFDDCNGFLKSPTLNAFLTASSWTGRKMNTQQKFAVPKIATVFLTGNNLEVTPDVARRFLHCRMMTDEADPQARKIEHVFSDEWLEKPEVRSQLLSCLWAIVRSWDEAGRPGPDKIIRGYEPWCAVFGGMVKHAGFGDPMDSLPVEESGNSELADMTALVAHLSKGVDDDQEFCFQDVVEAAVEVNAFTWMLDGKEERDGKEGPRRFVLSAKANSKFGRLLAEQYGGKKFNLPNGRVVRWGQQGKNRQRVYTLTVLE